jgi:SSS family solute:Na+ symporter
LNSRFRLRADGRADPVLVPHAPLFATFIIEMFWRRTTPWAGFWELIAASSARSSRTSWTLSRPVAPNAADDRA